VLEVNSARRIGSGSLRPETRLTGAIAQQENKPINNGQATAAAAVATATTNADI